MFNLHLSAEQLEIRDTVRDFVAREVKPVALKPERLEPFAKPLLAAQLGQASKLGLRTLALSEAAGGAGADNLTACIVTEELAVGDPDIAAVLAHTAALGRLLEREMTPAQRDRFLPPFVRDDAFHLALASLETGGGTALGIHYHRPRPEPGIGTVARLDGNEWTLTGTKIAVPNAPLAKLFAVQAGTAAGVGTLLVPRDAPGVSVRALEGHWFHGSYGEVTFENCRVPAEYLLGGEGRSPLAEGLEAKGRGSPQFQALNLGIGRAAYEAALDYAQLRVQGGRRIVEHQAIGAKLAGIAIRLEVARAAIWRAAWASDHPEAIADLSLPDLPLQTIAQVFTGEAMLEVAKDAAECFGAMGVMRDLPMQKYVHDARVCLHSGDGSADATLKLAEVLAGYRRTAKTGT
ncbi:MAG TPA: acyl-CoA dehydrogenase family protein [Burkholderiales bacterium]